MRHLALVAANAAGLVIAALIVDWRNLARPGLFGILAVLFGALLAYVIVALESKWMNSDWLGLEKRSRLLRAEEMSGTEGLQDEYEQGGDRE